MSSRPRNCDAVFLCLVGAITVACNRQPALHELPPHLQPLPGATIEAYGSSANGTVVRYHVTSCYPPTRELRAIAARIPSGWSPRRDDALNPGSPTSIVRGWYTAAEQSQGVYFDLHQWSGQWQNARGDLLQYDLVYREPLNVPSPLRRPQNCQLQITASLLPRKTVDKLARTVRK